MVAQFNRILQAFGSNLVQLEYVSSAYIAFAIKGWATFQLNKGGTVWEWRGGYESTARSQWLEAISLGKTRDESGRTA